MKFLFIQKNSFPAAGPMIISALLKKHGFEVDLMLAGEEKNIFDYITKNRPAIIGIPCFTGQQDWAVQLCQQIKSRRQEITTILGGPHPTYYPEIITEPGVDLIARGEAEFTVLELMKRLERKESIEDIKNLWLKKENQIIKNELADLPADLDAQPLPDRDIYYKYNFLKKVSVKQFLSGRGCPYQCTFCANNLLRRLYQGKGKFLRRRGPAQVIEEILQVKRQYGLKTVSFTDDVFVTDWDWLKEFLPLYKEKINLPFIGNVAANLINEETVKLLKENGCYGLSMGIESGDQSIRLKVLKKYITDEQIIAAGRLIKSRGLILKTYNIVCLPEETIDQALATLALNAKIKSDYAACSLLQPFPGYQITEYAKEHGFLPKDYGLKDVAGGIYRHSPIIMPQKNQFINLQKLFFVGVKLPGLIPLIKKLIKLPPNPLFGWLGKIMYGLAMSRVHRLTLKDIINYSLHIDPYDA